MVKSLFLSIISIFIGLNLFAFPKVSGDVSQNNITFSTGNLAKSIYDKLPLCDEILVVGDNGIAVLIPAYAFEMIEIIQDRNVWNLSSPKLPPVCNIRNIKEICIKQTPATYSITIKNGNNLKHYSPFDFILENFEFLGESEKNGYTLKKYKLSKNQTELNLENIDKIILTSNKKAVKNKIIFNDFYFSCVGDTIKEIILKNGAKK